MTTDLGSININIRELGSGGGGGGGGGGAGGGPLPIPRVSAASSRPNPAAFLSRITAMSNITAEMKGFISRPTIGGFTNLMSSSSATGSLIGALGAKIGIAVPIIGGALVAVGLTALALRGLHAAAEATAIRIQAVSRFSGQLMHATAMETLSELQRNLREAAENSVLYARAQIANTRASDAHAAAMIGVNKAMAVGAEAWHKITEAMYKFLTPLGDLIGLASEKSSSGLSALTSPEGWSALLSQLTFVVPVFGGVVRSLMTFIAWLRTQIETALAWAGIIAANTKPASSVSQNQWFMDDVRAMTGVGYGASRNRAAPASAPISPASPAAPKGSIPNPRPRRGHP